MSKNITLNFDSIVIDANSPQFSLEQNKYMRPLLLSYYMNTRQVNYMEAIQYFNNFTSMNADTEKLIQEYINYIRGVTITEGVIDTKFVLGSPKYKVSMIEAQLEMKLSAQAN